MTKLIQQDYFQPLDDKGARKQIRPSDIKSGTYYGQLQLRGSILAIKDNLNAASGYIAFGTDMSTIPTSPTTGTGILIDYSGIYGNNGGTKQFYILSSDGKAYAGAGVVVLDSAGITIAVTTSGSDTRSYKFTDAGVVIGGIAAFSSSSAHTLNLNSDSVASHDSFMILSAEGPTSKIVSASLIITKNSSTTGKFELIDDGSNVNYAYLSDVDGLLLGSSSGPPAISDGFGVDIVGKILRLRTSKTPSASSSTGNAGEICWDASYIYVCTATDVWERAAIATW